MERLTEFESTELTVEMSAVRNTVSRCLTVLSAPPRPRLFTREWGLRVALADALRIVDYILELLGEPS